MTCGQVKLRFVRYITAIHMQNWTYVNLMEANMTK